MWFPTFCVFVIACILALNTHSVVPLPPICSLDHCPSEGLFFLKQHCPRASPYPSIHLAIFLWAFHTTGILHVAPTLRSTCFLPLEQEPQEAGCLLCLQRWLGIEHIPEEAEGCAHSAHTQLSCVIRSPWAPWWRLCACPLALPVGRGSWGPLPRYAVATAQNPLWQSPRSVRRAQGSSGHQSGARWLAQIQPLPPTSCMTLETVLILSVSTVRRCKAGRCRTLWAWWSWAFAVFVQALLSGQRSL